MIRQFDLFNGTGSVGAASYWDEKFGTWNLVAGAAELQSALNIDSVLIHTAPDAMDTPCTHTVTTTVTLDVGIKYFGVTTLGDATGLAAGRVELRWREDFGQRLELRIPGLADQIALIPSFIDYTQPTALHTLTLKSEYFGTSAGLYIWKFTGYLDGALLLTSPLRPLGAFSNTNQFVGLTGRRENFGSVPSPVLRFLDMNADDLIVPEHDPAPTFDSALTRSPITVMDEKPTGSPVAFPYEFGIDEITPYASVRQSLDNEMGYRQTSAMHSGIRTIYKCRWMGSLTDKDGLLAFHRARLAAEDNFQVTTMLASIGTIDVCFADQFLDPVVMGPDLWRCDFTLVELM